MLSSSSLHSPTLPPSQPINDQEFNLGWVFSQLIELDQPAGEGESGSGKVKKRSPLDSSLDGGSNHTAALTAAHVKHVFNWMKIPLNQDEAEEVLNMMDENQDGRVTLEDFYQTMKVTPTTPFDSRYAINLPFSCLDATKDGIVNDEDYRTAREHLGKVFGCDNDGEFNTIMRTFHTGQQQQPDESTARGHHATNSMTSPGPRQKAQLTMDKELFKKIVGGTTAMQAQQQSQTANTSSNATTANTPALDPTGTPSMSISVTGATPVARASPVVRASSRSGTLPHFQLDTPSLPGHGHSHSHSTSSSPAPSTIADVVGGFKPNTILPSTQQPPNVARPPSMPRTTSTKARHNAPVGTKR